MGNELHDFLPDLARKARNRALAGRTRSWPHARRGGDDDLTAGARPDGDEARREAGGRQGSGMKLDERAVEQAAGDSIRAMMLIRTYRVRGHLAANLDPLGLHASRICRPT